MMSKDNSLIVMQLQTYEWSKEYGCVRAEGCHAWDSLWLLSFGSARLKSNSKQVCIDPKLKWIQEYLEKALNK